MDSSGSVLCRGSLSKGHNMCKSLDVSAHCSAVKQQHTVGTRNCAWRPSISLTDSIVCFDLVKQEKELQLRK